MIVIDAIGRGSRIVALLAVAVACAALLVLIGITLYEVTMRYALRAPTRWAFDLAWMLNGASFLLAAAFTLRKGQHVTIDVFSAAFPPRLRNGVLAVVFLVLLVPALVLLADAAWVQTHRAYVTGEVERVSAWQPKIWPFRLAVAAALSALILEVFYQGLVAAAAALRRTDPTDPSIASREPRRPS